MIITQHLYLDWEYKLKITVILVFSKLKIDEEIIILTNKIVRLILV